MTAYDVVIVGAGPAGTSCAITLAGGGMSVLLCDKATFPRHKICGDCFNPAVWPLLEELGVSEELGQRQIASIKRVRVISATGSILEASVPQSDKEPFFAMQRLEFDSILLSQAKKARVHVVEGTSVREIGWNGRWIVNIGGRLVEARFLVGADGRNSIVARRFGRSVGRSGQGLRRVGLQWMSPYQPALDSAVELFLFERGYCGVVNVDDHHANVAMVTTPELAQRSATDFPWFLEKTLLSNSSARARLGPLTPETNISSAFPIEPISRHSIHARAFLVGDARQTLEPFTGDGIYSAILDGFKRAQWLLQVNPAERLSRPDRAGVNLLYSFVLKRPALADHCVRIGARLPSTVHYAMKSIFRQPS